MAEVQPIRGRKQIKDIGNYLKGKDEKYYIMFLIGVQSGLRVCKVRFGVYTIKIVSRQAILMVLSSGQRI